MAFCSILFTLLTFCQIILAQEATETRDITTSGNYRILKCNAGQDGSMASDLQTLLPRIWANIQTIIDDTDLGIVSHHGFETFFHSNDSIAQVQKVFRSIANGSPAPLPHTEGRASNPLLNLGYPTIVCIQPGDPETAIPYADCEAIEGFLAARSDNFVALCPAFWEYPTEATIDKCPHVRRNTLTPNTNALVSNQEATLVHELAHMYGVEPRQTWQEGVSETYTVRNVADLDEESASLNAPNYAYYYSAIRADCRQWPNRALPHDNFRGLLEDSANSSTAINSGTLDLIVNQQHALDSPMKAPFVTGMDICNVAVHPPNEPLSCNTPSGV